MNPKGFYIENTEVGNEHIGVKVTYIPRHAHGDVNHPDIEHGKIKSWNDGGVFVDYIRNVCRTDFDDLIWG